MSQFHSSLNQTATGTRENGYTGRKTCMYYVRSQPKSFFAGECFENMSNRTLVGQ